MSKNVYDFKKIIKIAEDSEIYGKKIEVTILPHEHTPFSLILTAQPLT